jgi:stringent starvation protein B
MAAEVPSMSSNRPYLIRAMYEWIADNGLTPYLLADASVAGMQVPAQAAKDGRVVLNIAGRAVAQLELGNEHIQFMARFSGVSQRVVVPVRAVLAIYAQENGQGMMLGEPGEGELEADLDGDAALAASPDDDEPRPRRSHLRVVK